MFDYIDDFVIGCCMYAGESINTLYQFPFMGRPSITQFNKTAYEVEQEIVGKRITIIIQVRARMQAPGQAITGKEDIDYKYVSSGAVLQLLKNSELWNGSGSLFETKTIWFKKRLFPAGRTGRTGNSLNLCEKENQIATGKCVQVLLTQN